MVLPVLDYTSVIYHSMLNNTQTNELEHLQKLALKIVYGVSGVEYNTLLERAGIPTLKERRLRMVDNFIRKTAVHPIYKAWFPAREVTGYNLRKEMVYEESRARTSRLYNSPLFFFRRRLNCI